MSDRLTEILNRYEPAECCACDPEDGPCQFDSDIQWLVGEIDRLRAERSAVIDCLNLYGGETVHDALTAAGLLTEAAS